MLVVPPDDDGESDRGLSAPTSDTVTCAAAGKLTDFAVVNNARGVTVGGVGALTVRASDGAVTGIATPSAAAAAGAAAATTVGAVTADPSSAVMADSDGGASATVVPADGSCASD